MKSLIKSFSLIAIFAAIIASCETDPCKDVVCGDFGTCTEGICICDTGYEQDSTGACNTIMRAKFLGTYSTSEYCNVAGGPYLDVMEIGEASTGIDKILISKIYGDDANIATATVNGTDFTIDAGSTLSAGFDISGSGSIAGDVVTFNYILSNGANGAGDTCVVTMTRQ